MTQCGHRGPYHIEGAHHVTTQHKDEDEYIKHANSASLPEPRTFKQAMHGNQADGWHEATVEYNTRVETGTFEIVDLPPDQKAIGSGWVFGSNTMQMVFTNGDLDEEIYMEQPEGFHIGVVPTRFAGYLNHSMVSSNLHGSGTRTGTLS